MELWRSGSSPQLPLHRWPRCSKIRICVDEELDDELQTGELLAMPFLHVPIEARKRIHDLALAPPRTNGDRYLPSLALSALLHHLPDLRRVQLRCNLPQDPLSLHIIVDALSCLTNLEDLGLTCSRCLDHIGTLADHLQSLTVYSSHGDIPAPDAVMVAGIARLHKLKHLCVELDSLKAGHVHSQADALRMLLDSAPSSLEVLRAPCCAVLHPDDTCPFKADFQMSAGRVVSFTADPFALLRYVGDFAQKVLLPSRAVSGGLWRGQGLERFAVEHVSVHAEYLQDPGLKDLETVLQRCGCVDIERCCLVGWDELRHADVARVISMLRKPETLLLAAAFGSHLQVRLRLPGEAPSRLDAGGEAQQGAAVGAHAPPAPGTLVRLALQHLSDDPPSGAAGAAARSVPPSGDASHSPKRLLLLRGPVIMALLRSPVALKTWLDDLLLEIRAAVLIAAEKVADQGLAAAAEFVREAQGVRYLPLPTPTPGVLIECGAFCADVAALMVARRVQELAPAAGDDARADVAAGVAAAAAATGCRGGALELVSLPGAEVVLAEQPSAVKGSGLISAALGFAMSNVLQAVWDGTDGAAGPGGAPASEAQRLERVLQLWRQAGELGEVTRL